ncbi:MAG: DUF2914 domain-containing protein [Desulfobacteraceae bacterium]|nr:DUF2914 domain-containing protein [Desulfobacteraceae bacterium]
MKKRSFFLGLILMVLIPGFLGTARSQAFGEEPAPFSPSIEKAVMCESMTGFLPQNASLVFSISIGKVVCFTSFNQVPREMLVYHAWYRKDQLSTKRKLVLKPPQWAAFTEIQLRETDKGPWRVEVTDDNGSILKILRFSITD